MQHLTPQTTTEPVQSYHAELTRCFGAAVADQVDVSGRTYWRDLPYIDGTRMAGVIVVDRQLGTRGALIRLIRRLRTQPDKKGD